ncbi:MAG: hypothetical protein IH985_04695 [Planctomycetes bacterium]|nr:hypothetical protein [Planctomycetota bacterium]
MSPIDRRMLEQMLSRSKAVPRGTPCPRCGYELTGLSAEGRCPECGSPVAAALRPDHLVYSSPDYVAKLHMGAFLVVLSFAILILMLIATMVLAVTGGLVGPGGEALFLIVGFANGILALIGWWLLSSPDPGKASVDRGATSRRVLRVLLSIRIAILAISLVLIFVGVSALATSLTVIVVGMDQIVSLAAFVASLVYLKTLAGRMPGGAIEREVDVVLKVGIVVIVLAVIALAFVVVGMIDGMGGALAVGGCLMIPTGLMMLILFVLYIFLLDRTRQALKEVRRRQ